MQTNERSYPQSVTNKNAASRDISPPSDGFAQPTRLRTNGHTEGGQIVNEAGLVGPGTEPIPPVRDLQLWGSLQLTAT